MPDLAITLNSTVAWIGLALLGLIFLANALGILDQSVAARELAATGWAAGTARLMVTTGRLAQLAAVPCLFVHAARPYAAAALALFLVGATLTAHAFWRSPRASADRDRQLANFLKNTAIVGGLLLAGAWRN